MARESSRLGAALVESANTAGLSVEEFQLLQRTFEGDGVAAESFRASLTFLQRRLGDLERGVPTVVEYFEALGLSWETIQGQDLSSVLDGIADGLRSIEDPNLRVAITTQLLGRSAADMLNVLEGGSAALDAGRARFAALGVTSTEAAVELKALEQVFTDMSNVLQDRLNNAVGELAPELGRLTREWTAFTDASVRFGSEIVRISGGFSELLVNILALPAALFTTRRLIAGVATAIRTLGTASLFSSAGLVAIGTSVAPLAAALGVLAGVYTALNLAARAYIESQARAASATSNDVDQLESRLRTLEDRTAVARGELENLESRRTSGARPGVAIAARAAVRRGIQDDLDEIDLLRRRIEELRAVQETEAEATGAGADADALRRAEEEHQQRLNDFVQRRIQFYLREAELRRQVAIPEAEPVAMAPAVDAIEQIQQSALRATERAIEGAGDLNEETRRYVEILSAARNERFLEGQLIDIGVRQAERALEAQVRAGEITRETADASLIVNRRIAELTSQRLTAQGEARDAIEATLDDLRNRYPEIVAEIAESLDGLTERLSFQAQVLQTTTQSIARGLERGILRAVRQGGRLLDIFQQIGREIVGTILSALTRIGINALFGAIGLPGFQSRHEGGIVRAGRLYATIPGEQFVPSTDGTVVRRQGSDGTVINIDARGADEASVNRAITRALPEITEAVAATSEAQIRFGLRNPSSIYQGRAA